MLKRQYSSPFTRNAIHGVRSLFDTFYWIDEALQRHIREFRSHPEVLALLTEQLDVPLDLIDRLEQLRLIALQLSRDVGGSKFSLGLAGGDGLGFADLPGEQALELARMNAQLNEVGRHIEAVTQSLDAGLAGPHSAEVSRMCDHELEVNIDFFLREDDPGYSDDGDSLLAQVEDFRRGTEQWPDGYDCTFPMPHGGLMHELRLYGGYNNGRVDYRDILRIGCVWVDVVVTYQYQYDLNTGRWVNNESARGD